MTLYTLTRKFPCSLIAVYIHRLSLLFTVLYRQDLLKLYGFFGMKHGEQDEGTKKNERGMEENSYQIVREATNEPVSVE
jgi:hypothetical protein